MIERFFCLLRGCTSGKQVVGGGANVVSALVIFVFTLPARVLQMMKSFFPPPIF